MKLGSGSWTNRLLESFDSVSGRSTMTTTSVAVASTVGAGILLVQLLTESDPVGKCARFFRQLRDHVRCRGSLALVGAAWAYLCAISPLATDRHNGASLRFDSILIRYNLVRLTFFVWSWVRCSRLFGSVSV
jgi:hypothetical protein